MTGYDGRVSALDRQLCRRKLPSGSRLERSSASRRTGAPGCAAVESAEREARSALDAKIAEENVRPVVQIDRCADEEIFCRIISEQLRIRDLGAIEIYLHGVSVYGN